MNGSPQAELHVDDLKKLILMADSPEEKVLYIKQLLMMEREECRSFVEIIASTYPEVGRALVEQ